MAETTIDIQGAIDAETEGNIGGQSTLDEASTEPTQSVIDDTTEGNVGGQSALDAEGQSVVTSEPARDETQLTENFTAESDALGAEPVEEMAPMEPTPVEDSTGGLTEEEAAFTGEDEKIESPEDIRARELEAEIIAYDKQQQALFAGMLSSSDASASSSIRAIQAQTRRNAEKMRVISRKRIRGLGVLGLRTGRTQFAAEIQSGIIASEERALVSGIADLHLAEQIAVNKVKEAQANREFQIASLQMGVAQEKRKEKQAELVKLQEKQEEQAENIAKMEREMQIVEVIKGGEFDPIAISAALGGDVSLAEITPIVNYYKADKEATEANVSFAIQTGEATAEEIAFMKDAKNSFIDRKAMADEIIGKTVLADKNLERQLKNAQIRSANRANQPKGTDSSVSIAERKILIELGMNGDPISIAQLGYDPRELGSAERVNKMETDLAENRQLIEASQGLLDNNAGLNTSAGFMQSPLLSGFFGGGPIDPDAKFQPSFLPGVGNVMGAIKVKEAKGAFITELGFVVNNKTFSKLVDLKSEGATFGALSDSERAAIGQAATKLANAVKYNTEGTEIIGIKDGVSEDALRGYIREVQKGYEATADQILFEVMSPAEKQEALDTWNLI